MTRRHKHFATAFGDLAFAIVLFACGLFEAPFWAAGLAGAGMLAYWGFSRAAPLRRLSAKAQGYVAGVASFVIIAIAAGAYWLGLGASGLV